MGAIPWAVIAIGGLIGFRATEKASDELAGHITSALPWVAGGLAVWLVMSKGRK